MTKAPDTVGEIMTADVVSVSPDEPVERAIRAMVERDIGSVLVVEGDRAQGIFTERDLTRRILDDPDLLKRPVREVMSSPVHSTRQEAEIAQAFDLMNAKGVRRLAVVDAGKLVGIVTERDLLKWVSAVAAE
jgi:CBS domain-containing protein